MHIDTTSLCYNSITERNFVVFLKNSKFARRLFEAALAKLPYVTHLTTFAEKLTVGRTDGQTVAYGGMGAPPLFSPSAAVYQDSSWLDSL